MYTNIGKGRCKVNFIILAISYFFFTICIISIKTVKSDVLKFPINIEGLDKTVQINSNDIRQNPQMAAKNWLNMEGFNVRGKESKYIELVAGLSKHLIQKYNEYISAKKTIDGNKSTKSNKIIVQIPVTLDDGKTVQMLHYENSSFMDTVRNFMKEFNIDSEVAAQKLLKELELQYSSIFTKHKNNMDKLNIKSEIVFPVDFGNDKVKQFMFNPRVENNVYSKIDFFLTSNGILKTNDKFKTYRTILIQKVISESLQNRHRSWNNNHALNDQKKDDGNTFGDTLSPLSKIVLNLVVDNATKRFEVPDHIDAESAAKVFAAEIGILGKENENSVINIITQQIVSKRKLLMKNDVNQGTNIGNTKNDDIDSNIIRTSGENTSGRSQSLFEVPVDIDNQMYGTLKFYSSQRPKDAARRFIRNRPVLNDSPNAMKLVAALTKKIENVLTTLGKKAPKSAEPLLAFPVKLPNGKEAMFEYMAGFDTFLSAIDFIEDNNQVTNPLVDEMINTLEKALIKRVIDEARRYSSKFKLFQLPLNFGSVEANLDLYYEEPPLLAANAFCIQHSESVYKTNSSIALCTDTVVTILIRVLNGVENSNILSQK